MIDKETTPLAGAHQVTSAIALPADNEFFENSIFKISANEDILNTIFSKIF